MPRPKEIEEEEEDPIGEWEGGGNMMNVCFKAIVFFTYKGGSRQYQGRVCYPLFQSYGIFYITEEVDSTKGEWMLPRYAFAGWIWVL
jgi:hypothetical protein